MLVSSFRGWGIDPVRACPLIRATIHSFATDPMIFPLSMCSDLQTRQIKWISRADQERNAYRPTGYQHWGVPATAIAAQYSETHAADHACPVSGWRSTQWG
jgi:hypothetical protein